jgi:Zn-dependent M16 (insulinase) family peptidase
MRSLMKTLVLVTLLVTLVSFTAMADEFLEGLQPNQVVQGFRVMNIYDNASGQAMGARFMSEKNGFIIDLMEIESVPQSFMWIKTPISASRGEPHACEHLLLGKGNRGRYVAALEDMALGNSTAGDKTFYQIFEAKLQALLHPDFTDEEIRREVCHIGVVENPEDSSLTLDEKGTVYTEMVSSFEKPYYNTYRKLFQLVYGKDHPLTNTSGGDPEVMRSMVPQDMWDFHKATHHLSNMGALVSIPKTIGVESMLGQMSATLDRCQSTPDSSPLPGITGYDFPQPDPAPAGTSLLTTYPSAKAEDPGYLLYSWPADLTLDFNERSVLDMFLATFSNGETSDLYNLLVNSETKKIDIGATGVSGWVEDDFGIPIAFDVTGVNSALVNQKLLDSVRTLIVSSMRQVHDYADGSEQLKEFNTRVRNRMIEFRKQAVNVLNQPPMFGFRGGPAGAWINIMEDLEKVPGFRKSLVFPEAFAHIDSLITLDKNIWRERIDTWHLLTVTPFSVGAVPDPNILKANTAAKEARLAGYVTDMEKKYGVTDPQQAIARYKADFDAKTAELVASTSKFDMPGFIDNPPMTLDDQLDYKVTKLAGKVPLVASTFENMSSSRVGLAMRLDVIPESLMVYVPFVPSVLNAIGVVKDGQVFTYDQMTERLRQEVLGFGATYSLGLSTNRVELVLSGEGSNQTELFAALDWMNAALYTPYLSKDNLPRMLDRIDQLIQGNRNRVRQSEESWVDAPSTGYRFDRNPLIMSTNCFFTRAHSLQRLRWMLTDAGDEASQQELNALLASLESFGVEHSRDEIAGLLTALDKGTPSAEITVGKDLAAQYQKLDGQAVGVAKVLVSSLLASLGEIPNDNLKDDWRYLCSEAKRDLMTSPEVALAQLNHVMDLIRRSDNARLFMISNTANRVAALPKIEAMVSKLGKQPSVRQTYADKRRVVERLASREPGMTKPVFVGLIHEATQNGVLLFNARIADKYDTTTNAVLECLAGKLYGGGGPHGLFMKTWAAGLAYSNGYGFSQQNGRVNYYAERCPDVSQTMRFVVNELKNAKPTPDLLDYAVAQVFGASRAAGQYEDRGESIASDLADGFTPDVVRAYNNKVLEVRKQPNLLNELVNRMPSTYGPVMIGYGQPLAESEDGSFFMIGPEPQFNALEQYIATTESPQKVYRLYPRDFWLTM